MEKKAVRVRAPRGFRFNIKLDPCGYKDSTVHVELVPRKGKNKKTPIGTLKLVPCDDERYETHSDLDYPYHNKGWGALLYARAIQWCLSHGYRVKSSGASSSDAQRVWNGKRIRKYFRIVKKAHMFDGKPCDGYATWYAYYKPQPRKLNVNRRSITKSKRSSSR